MPQVFDRLDDRNSRDIRVLANFVAIFCRENHPEGAKAAFPILDDRLRRSLDNADLMLCPDCRKLLHHGIAKRLLCPYDPKPMCKKCATHCYAPGYREKMRQVMKFSGMYLVKHGRLDMMFHYLF